MPANRARQAVFGAAWLSLIAVSVVLSPEAADALDGERVVRWLQFDGDPLTVAIFNLLGVWPMVYGAVLLRDPPQRIPAWPFVAASFAFGGFALFPYLAVRRWGEPARADLGVVRRVWTSRAMGAGLALAAFALVAFGLSKGDPAALATEWTRSGLATAMCCDFVAVTIAWWALLVDDVKRHGGPTWAAVLGTIPIVGAPLWLLGRDR